MIYCGSLTDATGTSIEGDRRFIRDAFFVIVRASCAAAVTFAVTSAISGVGAQAGAWAIGLAFACYSSLHSAATLLETPISS